MAPGSLRLHAGRPVEGYVLACLADDRWEQALQVMQELGASAGYGPHLAAAALRAQCAGEAGMALRLADCAVEVAPDGADGHRALGQLLLRKGSPAAEAALLRAIQLDPDDAAARLLLASHYLAGPSPMRARRLLEEALEREPWEESGRELLKRLRKAAERTLGKGDPAVEELRRLAIRLRERIAAVPPATLTLCLIVKDEAKNLPRILGSVRGLATEVVVVDTGSTDNTVAVARRLGAKVGHFAWCNDFAAARNYALSLATGDWVLSLDADDEVLKPDGPGVRAWLAHLPGDAEAVGVTQQIPHPEMQRARVSVKPRLFRNHRGLHYRGVIHEQLYTAGGALAAPRHVSSITVRHHGYVEGPDAVTKRYARNAPLLQAALERDPEDRRARFYLGLTHYGAEDWASAVESLRQAVRQATTEDDFPGKAYAALGQSLLNMNRMPEAEAALREGLERCAEHPELLLGLGHALEKQGRLREAIDAHQAALRGRFGPSTNWSDWSCREAKPHLALCDLHMAFRELDAALQHLQAAEKFTGPGPEYEQIRENIAAAEREERFRASRRAEELSEHRAAFAAGNARAGIRLVRALLDAGETAEAEMVVLEWSSRGGSPELEAAQGLLLLAAGQAAAAHEALVRARNRKPELAEAWLAEGEAAHDLGLGQEAESALRRAAELDPESGRPAALLGELYLRQERWQDAEQAFRAGIARGGHVWPHWLGLGRSLLHLGHFQSAIPCYERAAALSAGHAAVRAGLGEARMVLMQRAA